MPQCRITISRYPKPPFASKYGIAITRLPGDNDDVRNIDTDDELARVLAHVVGHSAEEVAEIFEGLRKNPRYGPYLRTVAEDALAQNGF